MAKETHRRADVGQKREDDDTSEKDLPRLEVELVEGRGPDTDEDPVGGGHEGSDGNSVVGRDVGGDRDLRVDRDLGPDKGVIERGDRAATEPLFKGVEEELAAEGECEGLKVRNTRVERERDERQLTSIRTRTSAIGSTRRRK